MSEPIREALHEAAKAVLSNLSDRKGIGNELEQCDEDIQAEIGITVAAKAIAAFITALHKDGITTIADGNLPWMGEYVLAVAKEDRGYDAAHDDEHWDGAIVTNAEWGVTARLRKAATYESANDPARREELVVAASLLVAEIERIDRARERLLAAKEGKP